MKTIPEFFEENASRYSDNMYLWEKKKNSYEGTSYAALRHLVHEFAAGLNSLGLTKGDRVALLSEGRNDWVISELGILYNAAINVPLSVKLVEKEELMFRLSHAGVRFIIVSASQLQKVRELCKSIPGFEMLILMDGEANGEKEISFSEVFQNGRQKIEAEPLIIRQLLENLHPYDPANICYTSGTTAAPKGIVLTHDNYISNVRQAYSLMDIPPEYTTLLILPWDHAFAHTAGIYCMMGKGASLASVQTGKTGMETLKNIPVNIKEIKPNLLLSVPALASNFKKGIEKSIRDKGKLLNALFMHALRISYAYNGDGWKKGRGLTFLYKPLIWLYDKILFAKIREGFGGRLKFFIGGGALLDIQYQKFFYAIGMPMFQGYGLTEASPIISSNSLVRHKLGSSGYLVSDLDIKIIDSDGADLPLGVSGEICVKGPNVMKEYWNNTEATAETIRDNWLHTGDMGFLDTDGFLYVQGRFKSLLISDDGEKYSPEGIEEAFTGHSQILSQCMLYNNQNPYTIALIVPDKSSLIGILKGRGVDPCSPQGVETAVNLIAEEINQYRKHGHYADMFPQRWLPSAIGILPSGFSEENQMMNSTMKIVRGKIIAHYSELIEYLYTSEGKEVTNGLNLDNMGKILKS